MKKRMSKPSVPSFRTMRELFPGEYVPFGTQYYRAPSPAPEEWERDLKSIADLGFNTVKFWVQWRWNNPAPGKFDFRDIDCLMELAHRFKLRVMLNTVVDVAPAWIFRKYPDASMVTLDGRRIGPQTQPHRQIGGLGVCFNHPAVMKHLYAFIGATVRRYRKHPALASWNVASEPELTSSMAEMRLYAENAEKMGDMLCYCRHCESAFRAWLKRKYRTIAALNAAWNRNYRSFAEAELPRTRNTFPDMIDWRMFFVDALGAHVGKRFEVARTQDAGRHPLLSHHVFIQGFPVTSTASDPWNVGRFGDLHGITQMDDPMMSDVLRSCAGGKPVISAEMLMLFGYTLDMPAPVTPDDVRKFVFTGIAADLKGFIFWQYRPELLGREAPAWGLTRLDGSSSPTLAAFADVGNVVRQNASFLLDAAPRRAEVAILYSPENQVFAWEATGNEMTATDSIRGVHRAFYERNIPVDFVHPRNFTRDTLSRYKALVLPFPYHLSRAIAETVRAWVEEGGVVVSEAYCAGWNREEGRHQSVVPGYGLHELFGARQGIVAPESADAPVELKTTVALAGIPRPTLCTGALVREALEPEGAEVLATFTTGEPAITRRKAGRGTAILIGTYLGLPFHRKNAGGNGEVLVALVETACTLRHPSVARGGRVRVDTLTAPSGKRMLIVRNLESSAMDATLLLPDWAAGTMVEQFTGETLSCKPGGASMTLRSHEVKVYCDQAVA